MRPPSRSTRHSTVRPRDVAHHSPTDSVRNHWPPAVDNRQQNDLIAQTVTADAADIVAAAATAAAAAAAAVAAAAAATRAKMSA